MNNPMDNEVMIQYLELSKKFENKPTGQFQSAKKDYKEIFGKDYPLQHNFYNELENLQNAQKEALSIQVE